MTEGIVYQNKDIEFKLLSETYKNKSFEAYGLNLPRIKAVLPTNLPAVSANEKRMDNLFLLEDDTLAIVDYESENKAANRIKYVNYIGRVMEKYYQEEHKIPDIRMIVIYTGDVIHAEPIFEIKCMSLRMEQVFVLSGLLVASDKFINRAYAEDIRRCLSMTKVFQIFEEDKQKAVKEGKIEEKVITAKKMIRKDYDIEDIMEITELPREEIEQIQQDMLVSEQ